LLNEIEERIYPVGRLDYDTSGLLLLTNDGDFAFKLTHPGHEVVKTYQAKIKGLISENDILNFKKGILIDGTRTAPAEIRQIEELKDKSVVEIEIHEGRNRQVRKMCEAIGHQVTNLKRTAIGNLKLGDLPEGHWRYLSENEVDGLQV
jgi:23S rRNA pseudouridine2605 synthase